MSHRRVWISRLFIVVAAAVLAGSGATGGGREARGQGLPDATCAFSDRYPVEIPVVGQTQVRELAQAGIDIDDVRLLNGPAMPGTVFAYVNDTERATLESRRFTVVPVRNLAKEMWREVAAHWEATGADDPSRIEPNREGRWDNWYTHAQLGAELQALAQAHPDLVQVMSIGNSVQGRAIWFVKISDNVTVEENEPEMKFSSTIHGDEVTGMELCRRMIHHLVDNYGTDPSITALVNGAELWFCPLHNPDGMTNGTRYNAQGFDLNRNFPDPIDDPNDNPAGRPIEVQHMMNFQYPRNFILGANYHGGELVMNLPWDCQYALPPDNTLFWHLGEGYSYRNPPMWNSTDFYHGVTNGADWYLIYGGLQDWAYHWRNELHITIEVSHTKWPAYSQMETFWNENRDAMLWYMNQVIATGIKGVVTDGTTGLPLAATVMVTQIGKAIVSDLEVGDYHRMLRPGTYSVEVSKAGYVTQSLTGVVVVDGTMTVRNVQLFPAATYTLSGVVVDEAGLTPLAATVEARRHDNGELIASVETDPSTGAFTMDLAAAVYDVKALATGYIPETQQVTLTGSAELDFELESAAGYILVVNDGASTRLATDLAAIGLGVMTETAAASTPSAWPGYRMVVWTSGDNEAPVGNAAWRSALESFVAGGGRLLIEGGELGYDAASSPGYPSFKTNVLHISSWNRDNAGALGLYTGGHALATTPNVLPSSYAITYSAYGDQDAVVAATDAVTVYRTTQPSSPVCAGALAYDDEPATPERGQIVFYPFDYSALNDQAAARLLLQNSVTWLAGAGESGVPDDGTVAVARLALSAPQPNPAPGEARWWLDLPRVSSVRATVFDVAGREVRSLVERSTILAAGRHAMAWDGRNRLGEPVGSGLYWVRVDAGAETVTRRVTIVR